MFLMVGRIIQGIPAACIMPATLHGLVESTDGVCREGLLTRRSTLAVLAGGVSLS